MNDGGHKFEINYRDVLKGAAATVVVIFAIFGVFQMATGLTHRGESNTPAQSATLETTTQPQIPQPVAVTSSSSSSTTEAPASVVQRAYSEYLRAQFSNEGERVFAMKSERCQRSTTVEKEVATAKRLQIDHPGISFTVSDAAMRTSNMSAIVFATFSDAQFDNPNGTRWEIEGGTWKWDDCP